MANYVYIHTYMYISEKNDKVLSKGRLSWVFSMTKFELVPASMSSPKSAGRSSNASHPCNRLGGPVDYGACTRVSSILKNT